MRVCPLCHARYDNDVRACTRDGRRPLPESVVNAAYGDALLGTTVAGRYTIVGKLGSGAMGTVYRAEQAPIGREVALKLLRKDLGKDPETVARFHREAQTLSQLKHPNTVTIFDFGQTEDGLLFLAMELLEGEMLSSRIKRTGPLDVPEAIRIASGALRSLAEAHARGIIHRDLKPDNIFIARVHGRPEEDQVVKVVDFGIAKIREPERGLAPLETAEGTVFGTPRYMSPEQAQGKALDGRSDLYAVGVLLFHMLTGRPPFTDDDAVIVMAHHIKTPPEPVRKLVPDRPIPASLEALVARALEKDPAARPQTAEEFIAAIEATLESAKMLAAAQLAPASDVATEDPKPQRSRASTWLTFAALAILASAGGITIASTMRRGRAPGGSNTALGSGGGGGGAGGTTASGTDRGRSGVPLAAAAGAVSDPAADAAASGSSTPQPSLGALNGAGDAATPAASDGGAATGTATAGLHDGGVAVAAVATTGVPAMDATVTIENDRGTGSSRHGSRRRVQRNASGGNQPYRRWTE